MSVHSNLFYDRHVSGLDPKAASFSAMKLVGGAMTKTVMILEFSASSVTPSQNEACVETLVARLSLNLLPQKPGVWWFNYLPHRRLPTRGPTPFCRHYGTRRTDGATTCWLRVPRQLLTAEVVFEEVEESVRRGGRRGLREDCDGTARDRACPKVASDWVSGFLRSRCQCCRSHGKFYESMCTYSYFTMWGVQAWTSRVLQHMEGSHWRFACSCSFVDTLEV